VDFFAAPSCLRCGHCGFKNFNLVYREGDAGVFITFAVARLLELERHSRCLGGDCT
jgi:hypothetical protein